MTEFELSQESKWKLLYRKAEEVRVAAAFRYFSKYGMEPVLIKGWAVSRLYPFDRPRVSVDIDLAFDPDVFDKADSLRRTPDGSKLNIDLHKGLRHFDPRPWSDVFQATQLIEVDGTHVRVPCPEDHLRIIIAHWLNDGGANRERLWDIYYSLEQRSSSFDWDKCLNAAGPERRSWIIYGIAVAHKYLDLPVDELPFRDEVLTVPEWIKNAIEREWESGSGLRDLRTCLNDRYLLFAQIRKRIPPNPIQATIEMEKSLDDTRRGYFQLRTFMRRALHSIAKVRYR